MNQRVVQVGEAVKMLSMKAASFAHGQGMHYYAASSVRGLQATRPSWASKFDTASLCQHVGTTGSTPMRRAPGTTSAITSIICLRTITSCSSRLEFSQRLLCSIRRTARGEGGMGERRFFL